MEHEKILFYIILILVGVGVFVMLQSYTISLVTTSWTFRGAAFVKAILPILPLIFLVTVITIPVYFIVEAAE
jgi:hypothetical protein